MVQLVLDCICFFVKSEGEFPNLKKVCGALLLHGCFFINLNCGQLGINARAVIFYHILHFVILKKSILVREKRIIFFHYFPFNFIADEVKSSTGRAHKCFTDFTVLLKKKSQWHGSMGIQRVTSTYV